ncbi:methylated-DNA--[protein]-cysteine S-methyltransferase [Flammeovirgaceae bacterium SG7u.111]|nr:methylated-DNA--[protein]-cysteine S-methyltransferase [Flammeovirgaceae bacterium SG7u.132]WPO33255.1 methylated-DNA--[protein]-cysteine S-methyltransferase [Flammeovirgaceae bacterium SG7u.111]
MMKNEIQISYYKTQVGELLLGAFEGKLCLCDWRHRKMREAVDNRIKVSLSGEYIETESAVLEDTKQQLGEYFKGKRKNFDLPLHLIGTAFQQSVWEELMQIPYGETSTYLALSRKLDNEKAIRAVASANGANAISIIIPCHRIIGSDGSLVGYAGGLDAKKKLLTLEKVLFDGQLELF